MTTIGILSEGVTDHRVIERIVLGYFSAHARDLEIHPEFPPANDPQDGGWTRLKTILEDKHHLQALQFNDYLVVHVDSDRCEDKGFDVSRRDRESGEPLEPTALRNAVIERVLEWMGEMSPEIRERIVFAIAVDSIECWLLPLLESTDKARSKTVHCEAAAERALRRLGRPRLDDGKHRVKRYADEAKPYLKRKILMGKGRLSPSLDAFIEELERTGIEITSDEPW